MSDSDDTPPLPPGLRFLKFMVFTLMGVMIVGLVAIIWLLVTRLSVSPPPLPELPAAVQLPEGATPAAVTFARDWLVVVTETGEVLLYDTAGGAPRSRTVLP